MRKNGRFCYWICDSKLFYVVNPFIRKQLVHGGIPKYFFLDHFSSLFLEYNISFRSIIHFDRAHQSWIIDVLGVDGVYLCLSKALKCRSQQKLFKYLKHLSIQEQKKFIIVTTICSTSNSDNCKFQIFCEGHKHLVHLSLTIWHH